MAAAMIALIGLIALAACAITAIATTAVASAAAATAPAPPVFSLSVSFAARALLAKSLRRRRKTSLGRRAIVRRDVLVWLSVLLGKRFGRTLWQASLEGCRLMIVRRRAMLAAFATAAAPASTTAPSAASTLPFGAFVLGPAPVLRPYGIGGRLR